jgi:hypothetical protein
VSKRPRAQEPIRLFLPEGPDDPNIALIAFDPSEAKYWDNRGRNKLQYMFESARAYVKGENPDVSDIDQREDKAVETSSTAAGKNYCFALGQVGLASSIRQIGPSS